VSLLLFHASKTLCAFYLPLFPLWISDLYVSTFFLQMWLEWFRTWATVNWLKELGKSYKLTLLWKTWGYALNLSPYWMLYTASLVSLYAWHEHLCVNRIWHQVHKLKFFLVTFLSIAPYGRSMLPSSYNTTRTRKKVDHWLFCLTIARSKKKVANT